MRLRTTLAVSLALVSVSAGAAVVTVSPDNMGSWSQTAANGGACWMSAGGCVLNETGPGFLLGRGAWYAQLGYAGQSGNTQIPHSAWLGLDALPDGTALPGMPLTRITRLQYDSYVSRVYTWKNAEGYLQWPKQPIQLQITVVKPDGISRRTIWHRPWGVTTAGDGWGANVGAWQTIDCLNSGHWYEGVTGATFDSWAAVLAAYPGATLVPTSTYWQAAPDPTPTDWARDTLGWKTARWDKSTTPTGDPAATATGKCLNFEVGARKALAKGMFGTASTDTYAWWKESVGFRGYVDNFILGIDGADTAYDFEPAASNPTPRIVCLKNSDAYYTLWRMSFTQINFRVKMVGQVISYGPDWFDISDGSPVEKPIRVDSGPGYGLDYGDFCCVTGEIGSDPTGVAPKPWMIRTCPANIRKLYP